MDILAGLLLNVLIWAASAAVITGAVLWIVTASFPGGAAESRSDRRQGPGPGARAPDQADDAGSETDQGRKAA